MAPGLWCSVSNGTSSYEQPVTSGGSTQQLLLGRSHRMIHGMAVVVSPKHCGMRSHAIALTMIEMHHGHEGLRRQD